MRTPRLQFSPVRSLQLISHSGEHGHYTHAGTSHAASDPAMARAMPQQRVCLRSLQDDARTAGTFITLRRSTPVFKSMHPQQAVEIVQPFPPQTNRVVTSFLALMDGLRRMQSRMTVACAGAEASPASPAQPRRHTCERR